MLMDCKTGTRGIANWLFHAHIFFSNGFIIILCFHPFCFFGEFFICKINIVLTNHRPTEMKRRKFKVGENTAQILHKADTISCDFRKLIN